MDATRGSVRARSSSDSACRASGHQERGDRGHVHWDVLTIEGERKLENEEKKNECIATSGRTGSSCELFRFLEGVKATDIKATFEGGVLEIAVLLPVTAAAAPTKVEVTAAEEKKTVKAV